MDKTRERAKTRQTWRFAVPGPLMGFRKDVAYSHSPEYKAFKSCVRWSANLAGIPEAIPDGWSAEVFINIYWRKLARIDASNLIKSLEDSLFKQDRRVMEIHCVVHERAGEERAEVEVWVGRERGDGCTKTYTTESR